MGLQDFLGVCIPGLLSVDPFKSEYSGEEPEILKRFFDHNPVTVYKQGNQWAQLGLKCPEGGKMNMGKYVEALLSAKNIARLDYMKYPEEIMQVILKYSCSQSCEKRQMPDICLKYTDVYQRSQPYKDGAKYKNFEGKDLGFLSGMPDFEIPFPISQTQFGLYVELKSNYPSSKVKWNQYEVAINMASVGRCTVFTSDLMLACAVCDWWIHEARKFLPDISWKMGNHFMPFINMNIMRYGWRDSENKTNEKEAEERAKRVKYSLV